MPTNAELRPYGYAPGEHQRWCASCTRTFDKLGERAFKCRPCAVKQCAEVGRILVSAGLEGDE